MDEETRTWFKSFDLRMTGIEGSIKTINHELGEIVGELKNPKNGKVNPTVNLIVKYIVFPLLVILGALYGVTNI